MGRWHWRTLFLLLIILLVACQSPGTGGRDKALRLNPDSKRVLVLVSGLGSSNPDGEKWWANKGSDEYNNWKSLLDTLDMQRYRSVLLLTYKIGGDLEAKYEKKDSCQVLDPATNVKRLLQKYPDSEFDFVAHSLGGVVVLHGLAAVQEQESLARVHAAVTLDSPLLGVTGEWAVIGASFACPEPAPGLIAYLQLGGPASAVSMATASRIDLYTVGNKRDFVVFDDVSHVSGLEQGQLTIEVGPFAKPMPPPQELVKAHSLVRQEPAVLGAVEGWLKQDGRRYVARRPGGPDATTGLVPTGQAPGGVSGPSRATTTPSAGHARQPGVPEIALLRREENLTTIGFMARTPLETGPTSGTATFEDDHGNRYEVDQSRFSLESILGPADLSLLIPMMQSLMPPGFEFVVEVPIKMPAKAPLIMRFGNESVRITESILTKPTLPQRLPGAREAGQTLPIDQWVKASVGDIVAGKGTDGAHYVTNVSIDNVDYLPARVLLFVGSQRGDGTITLESVVKKGEQRPYWVGGIDVQPKGLMGELLLPTMQAATRPKNIYGGSFAPQSKTQFTIPLWEKSASPPRTVLIFVVGGSEQTAKKAEQEKRLVGGTFLLPVSSGAVSPKPSDPKRSASVYEQLLGLIPDTAGTRSSVLINDYALVRDVFGVSIPGPDADENALLKYRNDVLRSFGEARRVPAFSPWISGYDRGPLRSFRRYLGFDLRDVDQTVLAGVPPQELEIIRGRFNPEATEQVLRQCTECTPPLLQQHQGITFYSWGGDREQDLDKGNAPPAYDRLGRGGRIAVSDKHVFRTLETDGMKAIIESTVGQRRSLVDVEEFRLLARGMHELDAFAVAFSDQAQGLKQSLQFYTQHREALERSPLLRPYRAFAIGEGRDAGGQYMALALVHPDADSAADNVTILQQRLREAKSLQTGAYWSDLVSSTEISTQGRVLVAKLRGPIHLMWLDEVFIQRDPLLLYRD